MIWDGQERVRMEFRDRGRMECGRRGDEMEFEGLKGGGRMGCDEKDGV